MYDDAREGAGFAYPPRVAVSGIVGYSKLARTHGNAVVMIRKRIVRNDGMYCCEICIRFGNVRLKRKDARRTTFEEKLSDHKRVQ